MLTALFCLQEVKANVTSTLCNSCFLSSRPWDAHQNPGLVHLVNRLWLALQADVIGFFTVGIPLLFQWGFFAIAQQFANPLLSSLDLQPATVELTGTAAWLAIQLQLPLALSILMGFALQALILRLYAAGGMFSKIVR